MNDPRRRCRELLADRATHDLTPAGAEELRDILSEHPEWEADDAMEAAAAALHLALMQGLDDTPVDLLQRLHSTADHWTPPEG
jgi:hypothetical protein